MSGVDIEDRAEGAARRGIARALVGLLVVAGLFLSVLAGAKAYGAYDEWAASPTSPVPSGAYLTGDSITYWSAPSIEALRPGWNIEGVPGRQVQSLALQVEQILAADPSPRAIIVELGTNTAGWADYRALYAEALAPVPAATKIILVTPYRDPVKFSRDSDYPENRKAYHQYHAAKAMRALVAARPRTCIARWRYLAGHRPWLLHDGIHPTMRGRAVLAELLAKTVRGCAS